MSEESPKESFDYKALRNLMNNNLISLSYLPYERKFKNFVKSLISWTLLILLTLWGIRYYILISVPSDNVLVYYLCDANFMLGTARQPLNILLCAWVSTTAILGYYFKLTQFYQPKFYRSWMKFSSILSTHYYHEAGPFHKEVFLFYWTIYPNEILTGLATFSFNLTWFFYTPQKYWIIGAILATYHTIAGYSIAFAFTGRLLLQHFNLFIYGKYFEHIENQLSNNQMSSDFKLDRFFALTNCLKELQSVNNFYSFSNSFVFLVGFFSQIFTLYCIFFSNLLAGVKIAFASWAVFLNLYLTITFLGGNYAEKKV